MGPDETIDAENQDFHESSSRKHFSLEPGQADEHPVLPGEGQGAWRIATHPVEDCRKKGSLMGY
jgi:hypothetical protein